MKNKEYKQKASEISDRYIEAQRNTVKKYFGLIEESLDEMNKSQRSDLIDSLENIIDRVCPPDRKHLDYEEGTFNKKYARKILRENGLMSKDIASRIGIGSSTFSTHLKNLDNGEYKGTPEQEEVLKQFADLGYDPFGIKN